MTCQTRTRRAMAAVYVGDDDCPFIVAETPREVADLLRDAIKAGEPLVELTLANDSDWNAKPLIVRADRVVSISPPKTGTEDED